MLGSGNSDIGNLIVGFALFAILLGFYFLPSIVASRRNHSNARSIFILNFFLGWTFLGWVVALIWANSDNTLRRESVSQGGGAFNSGSWGFVALFTAFAIVAVGLVIYLARRGTSTQEVARLAVPASQVPENEPPNSAIHPDVETFRQSGSNPHFQTYTNSRYGFRVDYPESFIPKQPPVNGDGLTLQSEDGRATLVVWGMNNVGFTLQDQFDSTIKDVHGVLGYNKMGNSWFVVTWTDGDKLGYTKEFVGGASENAFTFTFPVEQRPLYDSVVTRIERSFRSGDIDSSH